MARPAGKYLEDQGGCDEADYSRSGRATADEIAAAAGFLREQPFVRQDGMLIVGHSAGAWGALALASGNPQDVSAIIAFAAGRGGHANDIPESGLRAAHAGGGGGRVRQRRARAGDLAGGGQ